MMAEIIGYLKLGRGSMKSPLSFNFQTFYELVCDGLESRKEFGVAVVRPNGQPEYLAASFSPDIA
jgi:hypothetical protein